MDDVFETLRREGELAGGGGGRLPEWLSTHPAPENRVAKTQARLDTLHTDLSNSIRNESVYMQRIQGLTYGDDPRQGFFEGNTFYHPDMRFQIEFPEGWQTQNAPAAVVGVSPQQDAMMQLGLAGKESPRQAAQQFLSQEGVQAGDASTSSVNGNPAATSYFQAQTQQGVVQGIVSFISYNGQTFGLLAYTPQGKLQQYDGTFRDAIGSFSALRNQAALSVKPNRIEVVKLSREMTLAQFDQQYPSTIPIEELAVINQVDGPDSPIPAGRQVKRVTGGMEEQPRTTGQ